jgi:hypothetical protein
MPFTSDQRATVENQFKSRAKEMGYKPGTVKYQKAELEFFVGAMAAMVAIDGDSTNLDPKWAIMLMSGRSITGDK